MLIFIDESGIHNKIEHSVIVLAYVCVEDVEILEKKIERIEDDLSIDNFHWADFGSKSGWRVRKEFLRRVAGLKFTCKIAVAKNPIYFPKVFENCLEHLIIEKSIKKIVIDGKKPRWYAKRLKKVLRDKGISVKKLRTLNDESSAGLRLADALAGLIRSYYDKTTNTVNELYKLLENKITAPLYSGTVRILGSPK